ncbi:hypothetical protein M0R72_12900 [Candidatus Pacearchaeota archaeon]|jgi:hypothetical protein|nr:hypothetical protein [Candidatus Pacearchaeota archaeon]
MQEAKSQQELDALIEKYGEAELRNGIYILKKGYVVARGNSQVTAWGNSQVTARENSQVTAWGNSQVTARENSQVTAWGNSQVTAWGNSQVTARENSQVTARENSQVTARENSQVTAWGLALAIVRSKNAKAKGNIHVIKYPETIEEWCDIYGIKISKGKINVYKAVDGDFCSRANFKYPLGKKATDPNWKPDTNIECGYGLHFCWDPIACEQFNNKPGHYLLCEVALKDIAYFSGEPSYPEKIRAKACKVICEVDREGKPIKE